MPTLFFFAAWIALPALATWRVRPPGLRAALYTSGAAILTTLLASGLHLIPARTGTIPQTALHDRYYVAGWTEYFLSVAAAYVVLSLIWIPVTRLWPTLPPRLPVLAIWALHIGLGLTLATAVPLMLGLSRAADLPIGVAIAANTIGPPLAGLSVLSSLLLLVVALIRKFTRKLR